MAVSHRTADDVGTRHVQPAIRARHESLLSLDPSRELWLIIFRGLAGAIDLEAPRSAWFCGRSPFCGLAWCSYRGCWAAVTGPPPAVVQLPAHRVAHPCGWIPLPCVILGGECLHAERSVTARPTPGTWVTGAAVGPRSCLPMRPSRATARAAGGGAAGGG